MRQRLIILVFLLVSLALSAHDHGRSLEFIANAAQWHDNVLFKTSVPGGTIFLEEDGIMYKFVDRAILAEHHDLQFASQAERDAYELPGHAWKLEFLNASIPVHEGHEPADHYYNYFTSQDPSRWAGHLHPFAAVEYTGLYTGIDMRFYGHGANFKYDVLVAAGADIDQVKFNYDGLDDYYLDAGKLVLQTSIGSFYESEPYAYQVINGQEVEVRCNYVLSDGVLTFSLPDGYDETQALIIDPELIASTLSGTASVDFNTNYGHSATFDIEGNIYTGCVARGDGYPTGTGSFQEGFAGGTWDVGISKLNPTGSDLYWATYIGGSETDYPHSLIANSGQELYVYGSSTSSDYPTTASAYQPAFGGGPSDIIISHLSEDGSELIGSTYMGGSMGDGQNANSFNYGDTYRGEIVIDYSNNPVIASTTLSSDFPTTAGAYQSTLSGEQDAVLMRLNPTLSNLTVSTYLGSPQNDTGYGVKVATDGSIYVAGGAGEGFPVTAGAYQTTFGGGTDFEPVDGFVTKFNANATAVQASTYLGTSSPDQVFFIDLDFEEHVFVYGQGGTDFPVVGEDIYVNEEAQQFISKLDPDLADLELSTTVGAPGEFNSMVPDAFLVDNCDNIYISAYSASGELDLTDDALFTTGGFYLAVYEEDIADIIFGTLYTGGHVDGGTSRFDKNGTVYQAVCSGGGFNTTDDAWATDQETSWDIGVFKINFDASGVNAAVAANDISGCAPFEITFENFSIGDQFLWDFGDGTTSTEYAPTYIYDEPGLYSVSLIASDSLSCNLADTVTFDIQISTPQDFTPSFTYEVNCADQELILTNTTDLDFLDYEWDMGDGTILEVYDGNYAYTEPGDYTVSLTAIDNGCNADEVISEDITIEPTVVASIDSEGIEACEEIDVTFTNASNNATSYLWDFGDGTTSTEAEPDHTFIGPASFEVILTATNPDACNIDDTDTVMITISADQELQALFDIIQTDCEDFIVETDNQSVGDNVDYTWDMGDGTILEGEDVTHSYDDEGDYEVTLTMTDAICDNTETLSETVTINTEVVAVIGNDDEIGCLPLTIDFVNASAGVGTWDFGDGSPAQTGDEVSHLFDEPGIYTVTLSVEGQGGCSGTDEVTSTVEVVAPPVLVPDFSFSQIGPCEDMNFAFSNESNEGADLFYWQFGDGEVSDEENPEHLYLAVGEYDVIFTVGNSICDVEAAVVYTVAPDPQTDYELPDAYICPAQGVVTLDAQVSDAEYSWSTAEDTQVIEVDMPGEYEVTVIENGCSYSEVILVEGIPILELNRIATQCKSPSNTIVIPYDEAAAYTWDDETTEQWRDVTESGLYTFSLIDTYGCEHTGAIDLTIEPYDPTVFIPNSFTPNGDGINDYFKPVSGDLAEYRIEVYNRWGDKVFESEDKNQHWIGGADGGEPYYVPDNTYTYIINYRGTCSTERFREQGIVTIIR